MGWPEVVVKVAECAMLAVICLGMFWLWKD